MSSFIFLSGLEAIHYAFKFQFLVNHSVLSGRKKALMYYLMSRIEKLLPERKNIDCLLSIF
jgi:hypothetical protein